MRFKNPIRMHAMRITALGLAALLVPQTLPIAAAQQEAGTQQPATLQPAGQQNVPSPLPLSPSSDPIPQPQASPQDASIASADALPSAPVPQSQTPPQQQQQAPQQPPAPPQQPVGTAAAPAEKTSGIPGSRPSGVAIAPAKQKRVRAFVISIGIVLAAGVAIGTVAGLSRASHSTPQ